MPSLCFHFWRIFALEIEFWVHGSFLSPLEQCHIILLCLRGLGWEIRSPSHCFPPLGTVSSSSLCSRLLSFVFISLSLGMMCLSTDVFGFVLFGVGLLHLPRRRIELINSCDYLFPPGSLCVSLMNCNIHKDKCLALPFPTVSPRLKHIIAGQCML